MKKENERIAHAQFMELFMNFLEERGEDVGAINSHCLNFPICINGEEGFMKVQLVVPKDGGDDNYIQRDVYKCELAKKAANEQKKAEEKAKKIAADEARRTEKAKKAEKVAKELEELEEVK